MPPTAIELLAVRPPWPPALLALRVQPEQAAFVGAMGDLLADVAVCPASRPLAIALQGKIVGYLRLEPDARSVCGEDIAGAVGLRSFFIDAHQQGRGLGRAAMLALLEQLRRQLPRPSAVVLTVNLRNHAARGLYLACGFLDSGRLYHGGPAGPQQLLHCPL